VLLMSICGCKIVGSCRQTECRLDSFETVPISAFRETPKSAVDSFLCEPLCREWNDDLRGSASQCADASIKTSRTQMKIQADDDVSKNRKVAGTHASATATKSHAARKARHNQIRNRSQVSSSCPDCKGPVASGGQSTEPEGDIQEKNCRHPSVPTAETKVEWNVPDVLKTEDLECISTTDSVPCGKMSADNSSEPRLDKQGGFLMKTSKGTDSGSSCHKWHLCGVCSRRCSTSAALKQHERIHRVDANARSTCQVCSHCHHVVVSDDSSSFILGIRVAHCCVFVCLYLFCSMCVTVCAAASVCLLLLVGLSLGMSCLFILLCIWLRINFTLLVHGRRT